MTKVPFAIYAITLHLSSLRTVAWTNIHMYRCSCKRRLQSTVFDRRGTIVKPSSQRFAITDHRMKPEASMLINQCAMSSDSSIHHGFTPQRTPEEIRMTDDVKAMIQEAIHSVDPVVAIQQSLEVDVTTTTNQLILRVIDRQKKNKESYQLDLYDNITVIGIGKAASSMVSAVLEIISPVVNDMKYKHPSAVVPKIKGIILTKHGHVAEQQRDYFKSFNDNVILYEASHPIPCEVGVSASNDILKMVSSSNTVQNKNNLVLSCISGGGSALFCTPKLPDITLLDIQATNTALLQTGWPISTMNIIRTVLEHGKGGGLAFAALSSSSSPPSKSTDVISFILSDVVGDPIDIIASGPTVLRSDSTTQRTMQEAYDLVHHRTPSHIKFPKAVMDYIKQEHENILTETDDSNPVALEEMQQHCYNCLVGNNALAVEAAAVKANLLGYHPIVVGTQLQGEASNVAQILTGIAQNIQQPTTSYAIMSGDNRAHQLPVALIAGGETTVTLPTENDQDNGSGPRRLGGRNQELALAAAIALEENHLRQIVVASVGTDGNDGPTDAAGAIVDGGTVQRLRNENSLSAKDALQHHNAYPYLSQTDAENHSPLLKVR